MLHSPLMQWAIAGDEVSEYCARVTQILRQHRAIGFQFHAVLLAQSIAQIPRAAGILSCPDVVLVGGGLKWLSGLGHLRTVPAELPRV